MTRQRRSADTRGAVRHTASVLCGEPVTVGTVRGEIERRNARQGRWHEGRTMSESCSGVRNEDVPPSGASASPSPPAAPAPQQPRPCSAAPQQRAACSSEPSGGGRGGRLEWGCAGGGAALGGGQGRSRAARAAQAWLTEAVSTRKSAACTRHPILEEKRACNVMHSCIYTYTGPGE